MLTILRTTLICVLVLTAASSVLAEEAKSANKKAEDSPFANLEDSFNERQKELMADFQEWYGKSRQYSEKGKDWVVNDIKNIGDWDYLVVTLESGDDKKLTEQLNKYGKERWEVYWVQKKIQGVQVYMKRRVRSYIKHIPVGDLLHLVPNSQQAQ